MKIRNQKWTAADAETSAAAFYTGVGDSFRKCAIRIKKNPARFDIMIANQTKEVKTHGAVAQTDADDHRCN